MTTWLIESIVDLGKCTLANVMHHEETEENDEEDARMKAEHTLSQFTFYEIQCISHAYDGNPSISELMCPYEIEKYD